MTAVVNSINTNTRVAPDDDEAMINVVSAIKNECCLVSLH